MQSIWAASREQPKQVKDKMSYLVYPEKEWREVGAIRWTVEWWMLRPEAEAKHAADSEDIDIDHDLDCHVAGFGSKDKAVAHARKVAPGSFWGVAQVQKQTTDWLCAEDRVLEWVDVGDREEVEEQ